MMCTPEKKKSWKKTMIEQWVTIVDTYQSIMKSPSLRRWFRFLFKLLKFILSLLFRKWLDELFDYLLKKEDF